MYCRTTLEIKITVEPFYLEDQSDPSTDHFVWAYRIKIENQSPDKIQLLRRHWLITDAKGRTRQIEGFGVIGEQPTINPGQSFEYTGGAPLETPSGIMAGSYQMRGSGGNDFEVAIPPFSLDSPYQVVRLN